MDLIERIRKNAKEAIKRRTFHQEFDGGKQAFKSTQRVVKVSLAQSNSQGLDERNFNWSFDDKKLEFVGFSLCNCADKFCSFNCRKKPHIDRFVYLCEACDSISHEPFDKTPDNSEFEDEVLKYIERHCDRPCSRFSLKRSRTLFSDFVYLMCNDSLRFVPLRSFLSCPRRAAKTYPNQTTAWPLARCPCTKNQPTSQPCGSSSCLICRPTYSPSV